MNSGIDLHENIDTIIDLLYHESTAMKMRIGLQAGMPALPGVISVAVIMSEAYTQR